jgi:hypothetical protein
LLAWVSRPSPARRGQRAAASAAAVRPLQGCSAAAVAGCLYRGGHATAGPVAADRAWLALVACGRRRRAAAQLRCTKAVYSSCGHMLRRLLNRFVPHAQHTGVFEPFVNHSSGEFVHEIGGTTLRLRTRDVAEVPMMDSGDRTGFGVWGAAMVLVKLLEEPALREVRNIYTLIFSSRVHCVDCVQSNRVPLPPVQRVLVGAAVAELGSGCTGMVGLACAALGARAVTLTDRVAERSLCSHGPDGELLIGKRVRDSHLLRTLGVNVRENSPQLAPCQLVAMELAWGEDVHIEKVLAAAPPLAARADSSSQQAGGGRCGRGSSGGGYDLIVGSDLVRRPLRGPFWRPF